MVGSGVATIDKNEKPIVVHKYYIVHIVLHLLPPLVPLVVIMIFIGSAKVDEGAIHVQCQCNHPIGGYG